MGERAEGQFAPGRDKPVNCDGVSRLVKAKPPGVRVAIPDRPGTVERLSSTDDSFWSAIYDQNALALLMGAFLVEPPDLAKFLTFANIEPADGAPEADLSCSFRLTGPLE